MTEAVYRRRVEFGETDAAGVVYYPTYFRWFDQATHEMFRSLGYPVAMMWERGYTLPLVEVHNRYRASLRYDDEIEIISCVAEVRTRAFRVEHRVLRGEEVCCEGYEVRAWARLPRVGDAGLTAEAIPDDLRAVLTP